MCRATRHLLSSNFGNGFRGSDDEFGGSDDEFEGQSMLISDWGTYMKFRTYLYWDRAYQGNEDWAYIKVRVWGTENRTRGMKCEVERKHETK